MRYLVVFLLGALVGIWLMYFAFIKPMAQSQGRERIYFGPDQIYTDQI